MKKVLMVCTGNTCRSVMAAALLRKLAAEKGLAVQVDSAGLQAFTGDTATEQTITVLREHGVDVQDHRSRQINPLFLAEYDLILTMTNSHKQQLLAVDADLAKKVFTLKEYVAKLRQENQSHIEKTNQDQDQSVDQWKNQDIADPFGQSVEVYRRTVQEIKDALLTMLEHWQSAEGNK